MIYIARCLLFFLQAIDWKVQSIYYTICVLSTIIKIRFKNMTAPGWFLDTLIRCDRDEVQVAFVL